VTGGNPDPQRCGPASEPQRRIQVRRLAVNPGMHKCRSTDLQARRAVGPPWGTRAVAGCVEDDDPELVARSGWDAHERDPVRRRHRGHDRQRPVTAGHPERVRAARRGFTGERGQVLARREDDHLDPLLARPLGQPGGCGRAITRSGVDEQHGPARRIGRLPAIT
jgi:hypothetical protein